MLALIDPTAQAQQVANWILNPDPKGSKWLPVYANIQNGVYVVQVASEEFEIAPPMFWTNCLDTVEAYYWYYNLSSKEIIEIPLPAPYPIAQDQPTSSGLQTIG